MYLFSPYEYYTSQRRPRCYCVVWASATIAAAWLLHRTDYCAFLLERREPHGVPSPCGHICTVCATVCLTVMPSFLHNRCFNYQPQFQDRQKPYPLISRRVVRRGHYRPRIKSQKTSRWDEGVEHSCDR